MPARSRPARASSSSSCLRAVSATRAPISPSAVAICSPMPREPPVTMAVLPSRSNRLRTLMPSPSCRRGAHQSTSNSPAAPMPPPTHIVTTTYLTPRRLPSISACPTRRAPDIPYGWPIEIAPPSTLNRSGSMPSLSRQYSAWQANASFSSHSPMSSTVRPCSCEELRHRVDRADAHFLRRVADDRHAAVEAERREAALRGERRLPSARRRTRRRRAGSRCRRSPFRRRSRAAAPRGSRRSCPGGCPRPARASLPCRRPRSSPCRPPPSTR